MHLIQILLLTCIEVITQTNCLPNRTKSKSSVVQSDDSRRRDINLEYAAKYPLRYSSPKNKSKLTNLDESDPPLSPRGKVLIPDLDPNGRPGCLSTPDDTYCEDVNNYPDSIIKEEIGLSPSKFLEIFGTLDIEARMKSYIDDDLSEERVCRRIPRVIVPKMAKNQANQWIYVVNEVEYTQAVVAEICEKEGKPCAHLDKNLPPGMYSHCRQKYSYKRLLALHPTEKRTYSDTFKFPSCCACYIKSNEILGRSLKSRKKN